MKCYSCEKNEASVMWACNGKSSGLGFVVTEWKYYCKKCYKEFKQMEENENETKRK